MTDLRTAAQQALEALGKGCNIKATEWHQAIYALRAALAQQAWVCPESPEHRYAKPGHCEDCGRTLVRAQQAEPVEPVAIVGTQEDTWKGYAGQWLPPGPPIKTVHMLRELPEGMLLYTAPSQRKPLTDEEIPALAEQVLKLSVYYDAEALIGTDGLVALVRAVEQAHGIKE